MGDHLCPSSPCQDGSKLIGVVQAGGRVGFIRPAIPVDVEFVDKASGMNPEKRFRFAAPCVEQLCVHWAGARCRVADRMAEVGPLQEEVQPLPSCGVRGDCRWFSQIGKDACRVCPLVVTDASPLKEAASDPSPEASA